MSTDPDSDMTPKGARIDVDVGTYVNGHDLWVLLLCMIRYSLGRSSYAAGECVEYYGKYKGALFRHQKEQIRREVSRELQRHAESGRPTPYPCLAEWQQLVEAISQDINQGDAR